MSRHPLPRFALLAVAVAVLVLAGCRRPKVTPIEQEEPEVKTQPPSVLPIDQLIAALSDDDPDIRSFAATKLSTMDLGDKGKNAVAPLTKLLSERSDAARTSAARTLGRIGKEAAPAATPLAALLGADDANVRRAAAEALGQIGDGAEAAVSALSRALKDPDEDVRHLAAEALGKIGPAARSAVAALKDAARDSDQETRIRATRSLAQIAP